MRLKLQLLALLLVSSACTEIDTTTFQQNIEITSENCKNITSYYWPFSDFENGDTYQWEIKNVSTVDILSTPDHGDSESRQFWREQGVDFASRVYPFRYSENIEDNVQYFEENTTIDNMLAIDELVAHQWTDQRLEDFGILLYTFKTRHPEVRLILWDASTWKLEQYELAASLYGKVDLVLVQHYADDYTNFYRHIQSLKAKIDTYLEELIPISKLGIAIGIKPGESEVSTDGMPTIPEDFLYDTAFFLDGEKIRNIALYAPIYFSTRTLEKLNTLYSNPIYENCKFYKD